MSERCFWCSTDPDEAAARHEGPHATWCIHYRRPPLPEGVYQKDGALHFDMRSLPRSAPIDTWEDQPVGKLFS